MRNERSPQPTETAAGVRLFYLSVRHRRAELTPVHPPAVGGQAYPGISPAGGGLRPKS